jgi:hypothetical protein
VPLVPVTVTVKVPLVGELHESVELPDPPVTLVGVRVQVRPPVGNTAAVSATVPVNPLTGAMVIVEVPAWLTLTATLVGAAVIVKSVTVTVTVAEWDSVPLVPVTVTV